MNLNEITHHPKAQVVARFEQSGLDCLVLNMRDRHYCGYVKTPFDGDASDFDNLDVHGGLTYGIDDEGWMGFDTAHALDVPMTVFGAVLTNAAFGGELPHMDGRREWDPEDVIEETAKLADQVAEMIPKGEIPNESEFVEE